MPVTSITSDLAALTVTAIGDYPVPVERLWAAWTDPRQLERFWGPPQWPATFTHLDPVPGGRAAYHMRGPGGESSHGWWRYEEVDAPRRFVVFDGFADATGEPVDAPETQMEVRFEPTATGSRFTAVSTFSSVEAMEQLLAMGVVEGFTGALSQLDDVLADLRATVTSAELQIVDDLHVVVVRDVRGTLDQVWRAHHEPALVQRWLLGPDGWTMPVCEVAQQVGDRYTYVWESGDQRFGFTGELLERAPPSRSRTTERMLGTDGPSTENELVLLPRPGGRTRIEVRITYPSKELRDTILATGMVDGMEASYARLEAEVAGL